MQKDGSVRLEERLTESHDGPTFGPGGSPRLESSENHRTKLRLWLSFVRGFSLLPAVPQGDVQTLQSVSQFCQFSSVVHISLNNDKFDAYMPILEHAFRPGILWFGAGSEIQVGRDPG